MAAEKLNSEEMRSKSSNWTLACDMQLRLRLEATKEKLHLKAKNLSDSINDLNAKTNNVKGFRSYLDQISFIFLGGWVGVA